MFSRCEPAHIAESVLLEISKCVLSSIHELVFEGGTEEIGSLTIHELEREFIQVTSTPEDFLLLYIKVAIILALLDVFVDWVIELVFLKTFHLFQVGVKLI